MVDALGAILSKIKIALIVDWLVTYAGGERIVSNILNLYPDADIFSTVDFFSDNHRVHLRNKKATVSFIQSLPFSRSRYRHYLPLMPIAIERFNLSAYDLVISCSHAVAKGVLTTPSQLHICYLLARNLKYAYEDRPYYMKGKMLNLLEDALLTPLRIWDSIASQRPDITIAPSYFVSKWHYHKHNIPSEVVYPPVDVSLFQKYFREDKDDYYISVSRLEPYKRVDIIVQAFNKLKKQLIVVGSGTQERRLKQLARDNIQFMGYQEVDRVAELIAGAKAFVFASREDWGIAPVEAQACGTPVIAFGGGGALESIHSLESPSPTGIFFNEQSVESLIESIILFERERPFSSLACRDNANRFSVEVFRETFKSFVESAIIRFNDQHLSRIASNEGLSTCS